MLALKWVSTCSNGDPPTIIHLKYIQRPLFGSLCTGVVMSLESSKYTVYEEDGFVEVCVKHVNGTIRRAIPVSLSTATITAGMC